MSKKFFQGGEKISKGGFVPLVTGLNTSQQHTCVDNLHQATLEIKVSRKELQPTSPTFAVTPNDKHSHTHLIFTIFKRTDTLKQLCPTQMAY